MTVRFELFTKDPKRTVEFYTNVLGFRVRFADEDYHSLQRGNVQIGVGEAKLLSKDHYFNPEVQTQRKGLGVEIVLEVDDIREEYARIKASGYHIAENIQEREWGLTDFRLVDPDGYYLRLTSHK